MASASYDKANQQTERPGQTQTYDPNGNLTSDGENAFAWNVRAELASLEGPNTSATFRSDPFGRRSQKSVGDALTQDWNPDVTPDAVERSIGPAVGHGRRCRTNPPTPPTLRRRSRTRVYAS